MGPKLAGDRLDFNMKPRVILWSSPRCLSTVFERSIRELEGVKVLFEPLLAPYHHAGGPELGLYHSSPISAMTYADARSEMLREYDEYDAVFIKSMSYQIKERHKEYVLGDFSKFKHTFLIRHPAKAIPSRYRALKQERVALRDSSSFPVSTWECGFRAMYEMYTVVKSTVDPSPIVIDADDLLEDPKHIMKVYCTATGLPFKESMVSWEPKSFPEWKWHGSPSVYLSWHGDVMNSAGFVKRFQSSNSSVSVDGLEQEIRGVVEESIPFYEAMHKTRVM